MYENSHKRQLLTESERIKKMICSICHAFGFVEYIVATMIETPNMKRLQKRQFTFESTRCERTQKASHEPKKTPFYTQNKTRFDKYLSARKSLYGIIDLFANIAMVRRGARMSNAHVLLHTQRTQEDCVQNHSKIFLPFFAHTKKNDFSAFINITQSMAFI